MTPTQPSPVFGGGLFVHDFAHWQAAFICCSSWRICRIQLSSFRPDMNVAGYTYEAAYSGLPPFGGLAPSGLPMISRGFESPAVVIVTISPTGKQLPFLAIPGVSVESNLVHTART